MQIVRQLVKQTAAIAGRRTYKVPSYYRQATMNDLPVPRGDFWELEAVRNKRYNQILGIGVVMFTVCLTLYVQSPDIEYHFSPPKSLD